MKYKSIINRTYRKSKKHIPMSIYKRAAIFAPFAALKGYYESINKIADKKNKINNANDKNLPN